MIQWLTLLHIINISVYHIPPFQLKKQLSISFLHVIKYTPLYDVLIKCTPIFDKTSDYILPHLTKQENISLHLIKQLGISLLYLIKQITISHLHLIKELNITLLYLIKYIQRFYLIKPLNIFFFHLLCMSHNPSGMYNIQCTTLSWRWQHSYSAVSHT